MRQAYFSYIQHLRPKSWPIVSGHMLVGFLLMLPIEFSPKAMINLLLGMFCWVALLNGGTLALNSSYDNDHGDIGYLDNPPPVPQYLGVFSVLLMGIGFVISFFVTFSFFCLYAACLLMSLLYSVPPIRLKAKAGFDLIINAIGYGALTFLAGYALHGNKFDPLILWLAVFYMFLFSCLYPLTQLYQFDQDYANNDKTFAVFVGKKKSLIFSLVCVMLAYGTLMIRTGLTNYLLFLSSAVVWIIFLLHWIMFFNTYDFKKGMYRALKIWAITDFLVIIDFNNLLF